LGSEGGVRKGQRLGGEEGVVIGIARDRSKRARERKVDIKKKNHADGVEALVKKKKKD